MKLRNISFLERHVEKFVLLFALLVLAGAGYLYWGSEPYAVEIDRQAVTPRSIDREIKSSADRLNRMLDENQVGEELANLTIPEYTESFKDRVQQPLLNQSSYRIAMANQPGLDAGPGPDSDEPYHVPSVPTPTLASARADLGSLEPSEVQDSSQLASYFPANEPPYDTAWISVLGQFDLKAMEEELGKDPATAQALPGDWWEHTFAIVDVKAERQRQRPDGTWPQPDDPDYSELTTTVRPMPGRLSFDIPETISSSAAGGYLRMIQQNQLAIVQPSFYTTLNRPWHPPDPDREYGDEEERMERIIELKDEIASKENMLKSMERKIDRLRDAGRRGSSPSGQESGRTGPDMARGQGQDPGARGGGLEGGGSGRGSMRGPGDQAGGDPGMRRGGRFGEDGSFSRQSQGSSAPRKSPRERRRERYEQRYAQAEQELQDLRTEYRELTRPASPEDAGGRRALARNDRRGGAMRPGMEGMMDPEMMDPGMRERGMRGSSRGMRRSPYDSRSRGDSDLPQRRLTVEELERISSGETLQEQEEQQQEMEEQQQRESLGRLALDPATLDMWVNDMYVEPGQSYRYRIRISVVNPLFNKSELPAEQREEHEERFLLRSDWSDWSREIRVEPMRHFFLTSASQSPAPGRASIETWRFFSGSWEMSSFRIQPGDPIGMSADLSVSDLLAEAEEHERERERSRSQYDRMRGPEMMDSEMMMEREMMDPRMRSGSRQRQRGDEEEGQQQPETLAVEFFTGKYLVDIDFDYPVPGRFGNNTQTTTRMVYLDNDEGELRAVRLDNSRRNPKRGWLEARREMLGPPIIDYLISGSDQQTEQSTRQSRR